MVLAAELAIEALLTRKKELSMSVVDKGDETREAAAIASAAEDDENIAPVSRAARCQKTSTPRSRDAVPARPRGSGAVQLEEALERQKKEEDGKTKNIPPRSPPPEPSPPLTLQHPLEGLEQWAATHPHGFNYAFLDDAGERETSRLDAATMRRRAAEVRDALTRLVVAQAEDGRTRKKNRYSGTSSSTDDAPGQRHDDPGEPGPRPSTPSSSSAVFCVLLVFPPGLDFLPVLLGAMAAPGVIAIPAYPPDPTCHTSASAARFKRQLADLRRLAADAGAQLALTTRVYAAALQVQSRRPYLHASSIHYTSPHIFLSSRDMFIEDVDVDFIPFTKSIAS